MPAAKKFEIDRGQQIGVDKRAMKVAMAVIDIEPAAERVQVGLRARKLAARWKFTG